MRITPKIWLPLLLPAILSLAAIVIDPSPHANPPRIIALPALPAGSLMSMPPPPEIYSERMAYPESVRNKAVKWSKVFEIPPSWLIPLGYVESKNQPLAENKSGATGALQIKLARARDLVTWISRSKWRSHQEVQAILAMFWHGLRNDLLNLELNVMLAAFELHHLRRRFGNDQQIVMAAYNQGEGCITRCLRQARIFPAKALEFITRVRRAQQLGYT